jgi:hypothetical protein
MSDTAVLQSFQNMAQAKSLAPIVLNYVWINEHPDPKGKVEDSDPLCSVPLHYLDKALHNAQIFPDARVIIWMDNRFLNDSSRYFVQSHLYLADAPNVELRDLNEIPAYRQLHMFHPTANHPIMSRADLARLLVVSHCFETTNANDVFYADFDVHYAGLDNDDVLSVLEHEGMAFGEAETKLENSFMAFRKGPALKFLNDRLIPETILEARNGKIGWAPLIYQLARWKHGDEWTPRPSLSYAERLIHFYGTLSVEPSGYRLPKNKIYGACAIN